MKEVYQALTIDVIGKCAFGIEVESLKSDRIDGSNRFYSSAIEAFASFVLTNRWMSYFFLVGFNMFPGLIPSAWLLPTTQFDCKCMAIKLVIHTFN